MTTTLAGKQMKRMALLGALLAALAGCNTVAGVGEDVSGGARTVQGWLN
jgi:predicted small secreted protein